MKTKFTFTMIFGLLFLLTLGFNAVAEEEVRYGAWVDEIVAIVVDPAVAFPMIEAGKIHLYAGIITCPVIHAKIVASLYVEYERELGRWRPLLLNTAGTPEAPVFHDGRLNPFAIPRIREAMHWLIDRTYVAEEIWGGMAIPKYFVINPVFPDYARLIDVARRLELYYAHDPARAEAVITEEMYKLGAERIDGIWHWEVDGVLAPVEIILLIRIEDERLHLGLYVSRLLRELGFKTYDWIVTSAEGSPIWTRNDVYLGEFHIHTPGRISRSIPRDQGGTIDRRFTPRGSGIPLWQAKKPSPELCELGLRLSMRDFECMEERAEIFGRALELAMQCASLIPVVNAIGISPRYANLAVASDLAGGVASGILWPFTIRFEDPVTGEPVVGGTVTIGQMGLLTLPWNPVDGSGWVFDFQWKHATADWGTVPDPFTGLRHPQRLERSEVFVREGLPVDVTLDWVDLYFVPAAMEVHPDAWVDWDAVGQRFITKAEASVKEGWDPERATADVKIRAHFEADLFDTMKWHDGSPLTIADFVLYIILRFDRADPDSPIFDAAEVRSHAALMRHFRGVRIVSEDPLIIETYTNRFFLDAEVIAAWDWFPECDGNLAWHNLAPVIRAEAAKELAFSRTKATEIKVEWANFIAGPTLPIFERHLADAKAIAYIPFAPTLGQFITREEALARYANLQSWFEERGHFWIGLGPFYLVAAHPIERIVHLRRNPYFPDRADKWAHFAAPKIAEVDVSGPTMVSAGDEAVFYIEVTFEGEPYPVADIERAVYLLLDSLGEIVYVGEAVAIADGLWQVVLPAEKTAALALGTTTLEVAVVSYLVAIPTFDAATFVLLP